MTSPNRRIGAQLWIDPDMARSETDALVARAAECGIGTLRIFLMWPFIEPHQGSWEFDVWDATFDAAARYGVGIKATLTANSGPWHVDNPSALHTHTSVLDERQRDAAEEYIRRCVSRYAEHPGLAQWVLWNEPILPSASPQTQPNPTRSDFQRLEWPRLLAERYRDVGQLNKRWRSGLSTFAQAPFPEDLPHPAQQTNPWLSFGPWIDEVDLRARTLVHDLAWVASIVREHDTSTPTCINPNGILQNHANVGYDFPALAGVADVFGASFHPPWQFGFAPYDAYTPVMIGGTRFLAAVPGAGEIEVTETPLGNTYHATPGPQPTTSGDLAHAILAPLFSGATSVTGWCLNTRRRDFEAGDWALLDDLDEVHHRARAIVHVAEVLELITERLGRWDTVAPDTYVLTSTRAHAVHAAQARARQRPDLPPDTTKDLLALRHDDAPTRAAFMLAAELQRAGRVATPAPIEALQPAGEPIPNLVFASHLTAWNHTEAESLLAVAEAGSTVVLDATSGQFDHDARLHRPWPGVLAEILGFRSRGLLTSPEGHLVEGIEEHPLRFPLVRSDLVFNESWRSPTPGITFEDGAPVVWKRPYGHGCVIVVGVPLGPAVLAGGDVSGLLGPLVADAELSEASTRAAGVVAGGSAVVCPIEGEHGRGFGVFGPRESEVSVRLRLPAGRFIDVWSKATITVTERHEDIELAMTDGLAVLIEDRDQESKTEENRREGVTC